MSSVTISAIDSITPAPTALNSPVALPVAVPVAIETISNANVVAVDTPRKGWHDRAVTYLSDINTKLDEIPNLPIQNKLDAVGRYIEEKFSFMGKFKDWLESNGEGAWLKKLALYLVKLPLRAAFNIVNCLYNIIKEVLYILVHPLKGLNDLAKWLVELAHAVTQPETWSKLGAGIVGISLGHAACGNPLSIPALLIGAAMTVLGISFGMLKTAVQAEQNKKLEAIKKNLIEQATAIPESVVTGVLLGMIAAGIQKCHQGNAKAPTSKPVKVGKN